MTSKEEDEQEDEEEEEEEEEERLKRRKERRLCRCNNQTQDYSPKLDTFINGSA